MDPIAPIPPSRPQPDPLAAVERVRPSDPDGGRDRDGRGNRDRPPPPRATGRRPDRDDDDEPPHRVDVIA